MVQELVRPGKLAKGAAPDTAWAYLGGKFVPIREAKISVMTHAFNYGTGVFEGVRAYWNPDEEQLYGLTSGMQWLVFFVGLGITPAGILRSQASDSIPSCSLS